MTQTFRKHLRLKPSILTSFLLLTVPVFITIIGVTYYSNDRIARSNALQLLQRFRVDAVESMQDDFNPLKSLISSAAVIGEEEPGFFESDRSLRYFLSILQHSQRVVSVYVGLADGSFRQSRRVDPAVEVQGRLPPAGAVYAYRWVLPVAGRATQIGPLVASDESAATGLLHCALHSIDGPVFLDLPARWSGLTRYLVQRGFVQQRPFVRMALGAADIDTAHDQMFLLAGPEFG